MREIAASEITNAVAQLCMQANQILPQDIKTCLTGAVGAECSPLGKQVLGELVRNFEEAERLHLPVCQDTGMAVVFAQIGQDVHITGGSFTQAVNDGVALGYTQGLLRCSVVGDPLERKNTNDNTPAVLHTELVPGEQIHLTVAPKGAGSENMSAQIMLTPAATEEDIIGFVVDCVCRAGGNPCPPVVVGVGIGSNFEGCSLLAKKALCRSASAPNENPRYAALERRMLDKINETGIGPQGFGGSVTALAVNIEYGATHIASLPVAVNMGCHVTRHASAVL